MIGRTFGRYRIVASLGEGGMGTVWRAEDDLLGRSVALKLLSTRVTDSVSARARLLREARAAGALDHPGIGTVYDAGEQDGEIFIAMRLVDGGTVADRVSSQGALALLDAVRIAASAADALGHAHARGILHRDVSARNLMLTKDGQVVVVDFGLALAEGASRLTQSGTTVGTAYYMAPEIALGGESSRRSDIYSLGAVLYEMLTGAPPFEGERLQAVLYAVVNTPAVPPSAKRPVTPVELDRIALKALAKNPDDRYESMAALRKDLDELEASSAIVEDSAPPTIFRRQQTLAPTMSLDPETVRRSLPWVGKRRTAIVASAVLLAVAAGGAAWFARQESHSPLPRYSSLAVLPFKNTSDKPVESEYLSEGIGQALINKLTQMSDLHVPPWITVGRFRDFSVPVEKLAKDLRVDALLFGTIRQDGRRIHGTVSIVDGKSGYQIWAENFDEPMADLFAVQNRIAIDAATKLLGKLSGKQSQVLAVSQTESVEAYEHYLKGSLALGKQTEADDDRAFGFFRRATEIDPRYAPAWVGIGAVQNDKYGNGWNAGFKDLVIAEDAFNKALEYDPGSVAARRGLIRVHWYRGKSEECLKQGKLVAASGSAGTDTILARAEAYLFGGLPERSLPLLRQVIAEEPANPAAPWMLMLAAGWAERLEESVDAGEKFLAAFGDDSEVHFHVAGALESLGKRQEAEAHYRRAIEGEVEGRNEVKVDFAGFLRRDGRLDEADRLALETIDSIEAKLLRSPDNCFVRGMMGAAYGLVGDLNRTIAESRRIRRECGDGVLNKAALQQLISGDRAGFVEFRRAQLRAGNVGYCIAASTPRLTLDPHIRSFPIIDELQAEQAVECERLNALY